MRCLVCGAAMETHREEYPYALGGRPDVTVQQVEMSRCGQCGEAEVAIPRIEALHRALDAVPQVPGRQILARFAHDTWQLAAWPGADATLARAELAPQEEQA